MAILRCQRCAKRFRIAITLEVMAIAQDPHIVLCAECELERERARTGRALAMRREDSNGR